MKVTKNFPMRKPRYNRNVYIVKRGRNDLPSSITFYQYNIPIDI